MLNNVVLMGRLTADPELRTTQSGINCCSFFIAVDRDYQKSGEERQTDFIPIQTWRSTADFVTKYFRKGQMIAIQGVIQMQRYVDKDGSNRTAFSVVANKASFCGGNNSNTESNQTENKPIEGNNSNTVNQTQFNADYDDEDLPF